MVILSSASLLSVSFSLGASYVVGAIIYRLYFHPLARIPGPLLAKITDLYSAYHNYISDVHIDILRCHERYGHFVRYGPDKLLVNTTTGFQDIYGHGKNTKKSEAYLALEGRLKAHSVLTARDKTEHGRKRRVIAQGFTEHAVRGYEPIIHSQIDILCEKLLQDADDDSSSSSNNNNNNNNKNEPSTRWSSPKDMATWANYFSFDIMTNLIFTHPMDLMTKPDNRFLVPVIDAMMHRVGVLSQMPYLIKWHLNRFILPKGRQAASRFRQEAEKIAFGRRKRQTQDDDEKDVYSNLLNAKDPETGAALPMNELLAETAVLIVAGSDTTSSALASILFYLSRNPSAYTKLRSEILTTFPTDSDIHQGPLLRDCVYLRACIDEGLRLSPPVAAAPWRAVSAPTGTSIDGLFVPETISVGTGIYALHHNPTYFPQPFRFLPERWIPGSCFCSSFSSGHTDNNTPSSSSPSQSSSQEATKRKQQQQEEEEEERSISITATARKAFQPFLIGARMCAAKNLALAELQLTVARIMWEMDFKVAEGMEGSGRLGQGGLTMGRGRERDDEFQLYSHFVTVGKRGPLLRFRKRVR